MGPYRIIRETSGRAYVLQKLNGNTLRTTVAAFRLIPYIKREHLDGWARIVETREDQNPESSDRAGSD